MSKDSLVKGTLILAVAALVARVLGVVQRIPLVYLIHDTGMATFAIAFNIYTPLLTVATAGIPSALSKLVSEKMELGRYDEADRIYKAAVQFALVAGAVMTVVLFMVAPAYARSAGNEEAALAIRALAPALLLFPLIAMMRGYFQGRQRMMPNGMSQIVEQIMRLITAVGLAYLLLELGWGHDWAVAGASFGGVMGSIGAVGILAWYYVRLRRSDKTDGLLATAVPATGPRQSLGRIYASIFRVSVPIVLFSLTVPLIYFIDTSITIPLLEPAMGKEQATELLGILGGRAQSLAGIPVILAVALSQSIVPIISSAYARKDTAVLRQQSSKALKLSIVTGLPVALAIAVAARPVNELLFPVPKLLDLTHETGNGIIAVLTLTTLFQIVMQTAGSILMGLGDMKPLVRHVGIGLVIKVAGSLALAPWLGIYGIIAATALCFVVMMVLNLYVLRKQVAFEILPRRKWSGLVVTAAIAAAIGIGLEWALHHTLTWFPYKVNALLQSCLVGGAAAGCYVIFLFVTRVYTRDELTELPGPLRKLAARFVKRPARAGS